MAGITPQRFHRLQAALRRRQPDLTVLLDGVQKTFNLSAVIRTCDAAGLFEVHSSTDRQPDELSPHHAQGSQQWVYWHNHKGTTRAFEHLKSRGFLMVGADLGEGAVDFREFDYTQPVALVMGAEKFGLSQEGRRLLDRVVTIPMLGMAGSLNVSVATALILYEAQRQRQEAGLYDNCRLPPDQFQRTLFEWCYPLVAEYCRDHGLSYPELGAQGQFPEPLEGRSLTRIRSLKRKEHFRAARARRGP